MIPTFAKRFWPLFAVGLVGVLALPLTLPAFVEAQLAAAAPGVSLVLLRALHVAFALARLTP